MRHKHQHPEAGWRLCSGSCQGFHLPRNRAVPSTTVPLTKTPRAIRVALLPAPLASGTVSPSIRTAWEVLALSEVWFSPAAVVSVFQLFTNCAHVLSSSSSSLLFKTPGFCHEPFPRHFLLSPSQSKITCKIVAVSYVVL